MDIDTNTEIWWFNTYLFPKSSKDILTLFIGILYNHTKINQVSIISNQIYKLISFILPVF
jgi:hypothetical protein